MITKIGWVPWVGLRIGVGMGSRTEFSTDSDDVKEIGKSDLVDSSSPDLNMANREKKKRKKRRQQRKPAGKNSHKTHAQNYFRQKIPEIR